MKTSQKIDALCEALGAREFRIGDRTIAPSFERGCLSLWLGPDDFYIHATPDHDGDVDSLPIEVQEAGAILEAESVRVEWTDDVETNVTIWWALVSPYIRQYVPGCRRVDPELAVL